MSLIHESVGPVNENIEAVIQKYGFELRKEDDVYIIADPILRKQKKGSFVTKHKLLSAVINDAVIARKKIEKQPKVLPASPPPATATEESPTGVVHDPVTLLVTKPADPAKRVKEREKNPPNEISGDIELDNTGKRERKSKRARVRGEKKENRYQRAIPYIIANPNVDAETLSHQAHASVSTAGHCLEAWNAYSKALVAKGWLIIPKN